MDGRPLRKVADYLHTTFGVRQIDTITTAGTVKHLVADTDQTPTLLANLDTSVKVHGSRHIAIVAHHDCAGNPVPDKVQKQQIAEALVHMSRLHPHAEVIGLWIDRNRIVERIRAN